MDTATTADAFERAGWPQARPITDGDRDQFVAVCQGSPIRELLLSEVDSRSAAAFRYLSSEGITATAPSWGIVDVGWYGNLQESLGRILSPAGVPAPSGLYIGMMPGAVPCTFGSRRSFLFDSVGGFGRYSDIPDRFGHMVEMFCAGTEGVCLGYSGSDLVRPVLREARNEKALAWGTGLVHETVGLFADHVAAAITPDDLVVGSSHAVDAVAREFWLNPSASEARDWGDFPFETNQEGGGEFRIAPELNVASVLNSLLTGRPRASGEHWAAGMHRRSSAHLRALVRASQRARALAGKLRRAARRR
ncbi:MAG: hypothetical protein ACP5I8_12990 [Phycisphaerae bacterium]